MQNDLEIKMQNSILKNVKSCTWEKKLNYTYEIIVTKVAVTTVESNLYIAEVIIETPMKMSAQCSVAF